MNKKPDLTRPYLVIPKLIEQPTWGGQYIAKTKGWHKREPLDRLRVGQSYELYSGSNLSLLESSDDPAFKGEITDRDTVEAQTHPGHSLPLSNLLFASAEDTLGLEILQARGPHVQLLIKYTQALGNSFQVHIRDGVKSPKWKPKPESWYYFEPGLVTLGVKPDTDWAEYEQAVKTIEAKAKELAAQVAAGNLAYADAKHKLATVVAKNDPWRFVNTVPVKAGQLVDLSQGGLHHSWEEDRERAPLGNVLYEIQYEALDKISTFRNFDKGKLEPSGAVRSLQIKEYFEEIDRSPAANDPQAHLRLPEPVTKTEIYQYDRLLRSIHYNLDRLVLLTPSSTYTERIARFKHLFVKSGKVRITAGDHSVLLTPAHSCFIPAGAGAYTVENLADRSEVLVSY
jgi:mannose-6-phosphate isomerase-like protein (cupin superfamily)